MSTQDQAEGLSVAEMSQVTGVSGHTLRYYERAGLIQPIMRNAGGQRQYQSADIAWVEFLLRLRATGMPVAGMREYARLRAQGDATLRARLDLLTSHRQRLHAQIAVLRSHEKALDAKIDAYRQRITDLDNEDATNSEKEQTR